MEQYTVQTRELTKKSKQGYRVRDLDLAVPAGSVYGFLGPNGAGKTTTLKMLLGLVRPNGGKIHMFGSPVAVKNRLQVLAQVGSLIESPSYYSHLTGAENLRIVQTLKDVPARQIEEVLQIVRLDSQKDKRVSQYSLGMKQRLGLACALLGYPKLLILDEPTNGLDPAGIQEMRELICSLPKQYGMTVLMSSHLLSEIDQMATHAGVIREGQLIFQGEMHSLHEHSRHAMALRTLNNPLAADVLNQNGISARVSEDYLLLPEIEDSFTTRCVKLLVGQGIGITRLEERKMSLEQIFLELTGKAVSL